MEALSIVTKAEIIDDSEYFVDYSPRLQFAQEESEGLGDFAIFITRDDIKQITTNEWLYERRQEIKN
jgi:hypothetical protein